MNRRLIPPHAADAARIASKAGFLSKRIWVEFFAKGEVRWINRQWKALIDSGLFETVGKEALRGVVRLSAAGRAFAAKCGFDPVYTPLLENISHDEELIRLALALERQGWVSSWMTEQELKTDNQGAKFFRDQVKALKIPDLIFEWRNPKRQVFWAVELEKSRKDMSRYCKMIRAYKGISNIDTVLVIAGNEAIERNIKRAQAKMAYPDDQRGMFFALMREFSQDPLACPLRDRLGSITLADAGTQFTGTRYIKYPRQGKTSGPGHSPRGASPLRAVQS